jgi:AcrR family transcriptional regulator
MTPSLTLTREKVIAETFALAAKDGLEAVTMRTVAARLGVTPMALYRHVGDKQGLLDGLVEQLLLGLELPGAQLPWDERLRELSVSIRGAARRYPEIFLLLFQRPARTRAELGPREVVYDALREAGVAEELIPRSERALSTLVIGFAASEAGGRFARDVAAGDEAVDVDGEFAWMQDLVLDEIRAVVARAVAR